MSTPQRPAPASLSAPADDGMPDPALDAAIQSWAQSNWQGSRAHQRAVIEAFRTARVYVPGLAPDGDQVAMVALRREDGMTALAVFTGIERMLQWRDDVRPLPHIGSVVASMARDDGHTMCLIDLDGPITVTLPLADILADDPPH